MPFASILAQPVLSQTLWSIDVRDLVGGAAIFQHSHETLLKTASVAKLFLLLELAESITRGDVDPSAPVSKSSVPLVKDSGLWQHLDAETLSVNDAARLVGTVSDNLATNALLELVGLTKVQARAARWATHGSALHDHVRDLRGPGHPTTLSEGTAYDWAEFFGQLSTNRLSSRTVDQQLLEWVRNSADLSMVASGFDLDPLSHGADVDGSLTLWNKTGTDAGIRADVGLVHGQRTRISYAVLCNWDPTNHDVLHHVLTAMREMGEVIARLACAEHP